MSLQRHRHKRYSESGVASSVYSNSGRGSDATTSQIQSAAGATATARSAVLQSASVSANSAVPTISAAFSDDSRVIFVASNETFTMSGSDGLSGSAVARATTFSTVRTGASAVLMTGVLSSATVGQFVATVLSIASPTQTEAISSGSAISATETAAAIASTGLSTSSKAIVGGVVGGLGGIGLVCALVFVLLNKGNKRKRPESAEQLNTPQRFDDKHSSYRSSLPPSTPSRMRSTLTLVSSARQRTRKNSEPPSPSTPSGFQVISGRRLSSPPHFDHPPGVATRLSTSTHSSPAGSPFNTPSRRSRLGGTPTVFRDPIGRSQELGSTVSHTSRFVEAIGVDD